MDRDKQGPRYAPFIEWGTKAKPLFIKIKIDASFAKAQLERLALQLQGIFLYPEQIQIERDEQRQTEVEEIVQCLEEGPTPVGAC